MCATLHNSHACLWTAFWQLVCGSSTIISCHAGLSLVINSNNNNEKNLRWGEKYHKKGKYFYWIQSQRVINWTLEEFGIRFCKSVDVCARTRWTQENCNNTVNKNKRNYMSRHRIIFHPIFAYAHTSAQTLHNIGIGIFYSILRTDSMRSVRFELKLIVRQVNKRPLFVK